MENNKSEKRYLEIVETNIANRNTVCDIDVYKSKEKEYMFSKKALQDQLTMYGQVQDWQSMMPPETGTAQQAAYLTKEEYDEGESTIIEALIQDGEKPEVAFARLEKEGVDPNTRISEYIANRQKAKDDKEDLSPTGRMRARQAELDTIQSETKEADAEYARVMETFVDSKSTLEQGFYNNRLGLMRRKQAWLLADAEDAALHAQQVIKINKAWEEKE